MLKQITKHDVELAINSRAVKVQGVCGKLEGQEEAIVEDGSLTVLTFDECMASESFIDELSFLSHDTSISPLTFNKTVQGAVENDIATWKSTGDNTDNDPSSDGALSCPDEFFAPDGTTNDYSPMAKLNSVVFHDVGVLSPLSIG